MSAYERVVESQLMFMNWIILCFERNHVFHERNLFIQMKWMIMRIQVLLMKRRVSQNSYQVNQSLNKKNDESYSDLQLTSSKSQKRIYIWFSCLSKLFYRDINESIDMTLMRYIINIFPFLHWIVGAKFIKFDQTL